MHPQDSKTMQEFKVKKNQDWTDDSNFKNSHQVNIVQEAWRLALLVLSQFWENSNMFVQLANWFLMYSVLCDQ